MVRKYELTELFNKHMVKLPKETEEMTVQALLLGSRLSPKGGIYVYFNKHNEPLYVGISYNVSSRVIQHLKRDRGNSDLYSHVHNHIGCYVIVYYEPLITYREVYESYLIHILQPRFNVAKTDRERV